MAPARRRIDQSQPGRGNDRGHAFLLIGYDEIGFWILNSWGDTWGRAGFANLSYADWEANGMDAWVGQLGVKRSMGHVLSLASGLNFDLVRNADLNPVTARNILLSGNDSIRAPGRLSSGGRCLSIRQRWSATGLPMPRNGD